MPRFLVTYEIGLVVNAEDSREALELAADADITSFEILEVGDVEEVV